MVLLLSFRLENDENNVYVLLALDPIFPMSAKDLISGKLDKLLAVLPMKLFFPSPLAFSTLTREREDKSSK